MSKFEKVISFIFDILIIGVLGYGIVYGNNFNVAEIKMVMAISLMINLALIEYMLYSVSRKRG